MATLGATCSWSSGPACVASCAHDVKNTPPKKPPKTAFKTAVLCRRIAIARHLSLSQTPTNTNNRALVVLYDIAQLWQINIGFESPYLALRAQYGLWLRLCARAGALARIRLRSRLCARAGALARIRLRSRAMCSGWGPCAHTPGYWRLINLDYFLAYMYNDWYNNTVVLAIQPSIKDLIKN